MAEAQLAVKYDHQTLFHYSSDHRRVAVTMRLAAPSCPMLEFTAKLHPSTTITAIEDLIINRHGGSIQKLSICINKFHPDEIVSPNKTLEECGILDGECIVYYDFVPISGSLLS